MHASFKSILAALVGVALPLLACESTPPSTADPGEALPAEAPVETRDPTDPGPAEGTKDAGKDGAPGYECRLAGPWKVAPSATCSAAALACIEKAKTGADASACIQAEASCSGCFNDVVVGCLVGSTARPGPCAAQAGCVDGCVASVCGKKPSDSCRTNALTKGACKSVSNDLQACLEKADQTPCRDEFKNECLPKTTCGNGTVEAGEACDGNCPSSCPAPAPGDLCTKNVLKGSAATCSAVCDAQSVCPLGCPTNAAPISTVGVIASGTDLPSTTKVSWPSLGSLNANGCPSVASGASHVIAWRAPAAGNYTFSGTCSVVWESNEIGTGNPYSYALQCVRRVAIAHGAQCASSVDAFACSLDVDNSFQQPQYPDKANLAPIALAAGDEVLIAVDFGLASALPAAQTSTSYNGHVSSSSWSVKVTSCVPQCTGKTCGSDGCGGSCGTCGAGQTCTGGTCQSACVPHCAGKTCGSDGCGGSCGTCGAGQICTTLSTCESSAGCDPVSNTGCASPNQCITLSNETSQCAVVGSGFAGSPCASSTDCRGGHGCFAGTCRKICDVATSDGCSFSETCAPVSGWVSHGVCTKWRTRNEACDSPSQASKRSRDACAFVLTRIAR